MTQHRFQRARIVGTAVLIGALAASIAGCAGSTTPGGSSSPSASGGQTVDESLRAMVPDDIKKSGEIQIAGSFDNPPAIYADPNDATKPAGIAYEMSVAIGEILGLEPVWTNTAWPGQLPGLDAGTFNIVWGQASDTAAREATLYDIIPFYAAPAGALVAEGNPLKISSWATMCGAKVAVPTGSIQQVWIAQANKKFCEPSGKKDITFTEYASNPATYSALTSGQVDVIVDAWPVVKAQGAAISGTEAVELSDAADIDAGLQAIVFSKEVPGLTKAVQGAIQVMYKNGTMDEIFKAHDSMDALVPAENAVINFLTGVPVGTKDPSKDPTQG